jgi:alkylation response protein AidB-like acyl-CoA dehydrogenase
VIDIATPEEQGERQQVDRCRHALRVGDRRVPAVQRQRQQHPQPEGQGDRGQRDRHRGAAPAAHRRQVDLQTDDEHEQDQPDLGDHVEVGPHLGREQHEVQVPGQQAQQAGPERDARDDLADDRGLAHPLEGPPEHAGGGHHDGDVEQDEQEDLAGGHAALVPCRATGLGRGWGEPPPWPPLRRRRHLASPGWGQHPRVHRVPSPVPAASVRGAPRFPSGGAAGQAGAMTPTAPPDPDGLDATERAVVDVVRDFVERDVRPVVRGLERADTYPEALVEQMKRLGVFGLAVPEPWGEVRVSTPCYALVTEELARGWMSLAGAMGGHTVVAKLITAFGTAGQRDRWLPLLATGEVRATMALTEPGGGSDLQAMRTVARRDGDSYVIDGAKTWITNARRSALVALLCRTDPTADPPHRGVSILLVEKVPGFTVAKDLPKLGYKGVESCELVFDGARVPAGALLGGEEGRGFAQMMTGLEIGRVQVAARATGVARAAFDDALRYAQERESFGRPIWQHQSVGNLLADMATQLTAARQLLLHAARRVESGQRSDLEAGMAKLFCSEAAMEIALSAIRVHGGYGYSTEFDVERYFRDAPLMIVGEGTNEIQRGVIARRLVERGLP